MPKKLFSTSDFPAMRGLRLDKALSLLEEIQTRSRAETLLEKGLIQVNEKIEKSSYKVKGTELISVQFPEEVTGDLVPFPLALDIRFEDEHLLVVNKPSGLVVHPGAGHETETLVNALVAHTPSLSMKYLEKRPGIVHRIDKDTSGLLVVAKNDRSHEFLAQQFKNKTAHRVYQAVLWGRPSVPTGVIKSYLARHPTHRKLFASVRDSLGKIIRDPATPPEIGKWAITTYKVLQQKDALALTQFRLETGRTHQIRVHATEMGNPLVGDVVYGSNKKLNQLSNLGLKAEISSLNRFLLHAGELGFIHPISGEALMFSCDWPASEIDLLRRFGLRE